MKIIVAEIVDYDISQNIARVMSDGLYYDLRTYSASGKKTPDFNKDAALWIHEGYRDEYPVGKDDPFDPGTLSKGIALIIAIGESVNPEVSTGDYPGSMTSADTSPSTNDAMWIPGLVDADGITQSGICIGNDGTIILKSPGGTISLGSEGVITEGKTLTQSSMENRSKAITIPNPLSFLPSVFFLPIPEELPDFSRIVRTVGILRMLKDLSKLVVGSK